MHRICLCPASIAWIRKHLMKSARAKFSKLIAKGSISKIKHRRKTKGKSKRRKGKKLRPGIHHVKIHGRSRKVKVLRNGQWRFMKGKWEMIYIIPGLNLRS